MSNRTALLLVFANALLFFAVVVAYALWLTPPRPPKLAVLDVGELYRLKENQVATVLVKRDASEADRARAIERASAFGAELTQLIRTLAQECSCLILARGAIVGPPPLLPDLTPEVRRRLDL